MKIEKEKKNFVEQVKDSNSKHLVEKENNTEFSTQRKEFGENDLITGEQLLAYKLTEIPWLVEPIFPRVGIAALAGSSDTGKSALLRQLAIAISGKDSTFLGYPLKCQHGNAIYVSTEDDKEPTAVLLKKQIADYYQNHHFDNLRFLFGSHKVVARLDEQLSIQKADCVIVDAFSDVLDGRDANNV
ncbi:AAA family ATPase, partial [Nostoc sp. CHAB 5834]|nr:AAA family ATPase [Nostoc sp. CHAB 5834]